MVSSANHSSLLKTCCLHLTRVHWQNCVVYSELEFVSKILLLERINVRYRKYVVSSVMSAAAMVLSSTFVVEIVLVVANHSSLPKACCLWRNKVHYQKHVVHSELEFGVEIVLSLVNQCLVSN